MKDDLVKQYLINERKIKRLDDKMQVFAEAKNKEITDLQWEVYEPKIRALIDERNEAIESLRAEQIKRKTDTQRKISDLYVVISQVERIMAFLKATKDLEIKDNDIHTYDDRFIESLGFLYNDKYLKIKIFIVENDKPKNKYSLVAFGKCLFTKELLELPYSYGMPTHESDWYSLKIMLKDLPEIDELKAYFNRNKDSILTMLTTEYLKVKQEYMETLQKHKREDFQKLIAYQCSCGYFYTKREAKNFSRRTSQEVKCPVCLKVMERKRIG